MTLLSKDHRILEKGPMEFRPFGVNPDGTKIRDVSGISIRSIVDYLEDCMTRKEGNGALAVEDLCRLLNERIRDPAYHVTPAFLRNAWNSYSYEFVSFVREFGIVLSGDHNSTSMQGGNGTFHHCCRSWAAPSHRHRSTTCGRISVRNTRRTP